MKNIKKIWGIALVAFMLIISAPHKTMAQEGEYISDQEFYDELQPYGTWIYDPQYGNVWVPDVEEDFRPYATRGYWAMTNYGNTWVSDYPWGWATFHYGRWHFDNYYGWEWVPGNEWAPAWVSWRNGGGYYGWAPMEPGISIDASFSDNYSVPDDYWVFAPYAYINYTNVYNYYVPRPRIRTIIRNTTWVRNRYTYDNHTYIAGPRRDEIQRYTHRPVRVYNITNVNRPSRITVNNNNINIYRPSVRPSNGARPARVVDGNAYKQQNPAQRIADRDHQRGVRYNPANAAKLAEAARNNNPDTKVIRINNDDNRAPRATRPSVNGNVQQQQRDIDRQQATEQQRQLRDQQRQQADQSRRQQQQSREQQMQQTDQQRQQADQSRQQQRQTREQQRLNRPAVNNNAAQPELQQRQQAEQVRQQQRQQTDQIREQQRQQREQAVQVRQQQQQAREQQRQQADQQRQQQDQQRQQAEQQRQQVEQQRQQADQQRQQQQQAREQQRQQAEQQRQQADQQRQQQQQAREQQRQQQDQQRQQAEQQRQQQQQAREQQRQQAEQQRQQQQQQATPSPRPVRN